MTKLSYMYIHGPLFIYCITQATGGILFYHLHQFENSIYISTPISFLPFKDKTYCFSHFTVLPFENQLDTETIGSYSNKVDKVEEDSTDEEDEMFIQSLFEEIEFPAEKYKWLNMKTHFFKKNHCLVVSTLMKANYNIT